MTALPPDLLPALAFAFVVFVIVATDGAYWELQRRKDEQARQTKHEYAPRVGKER